MSGLLHAQPAPLEALLVAGAAFAFTVLLTWPIIKTLRLHEFGKAIRADGPDHAEKAGTPTMGGMAMLVVIGFVAVFVAWRFETVWPLWVLLAMVMFAAIGLADDLQGLARRNGDGDAGVGLTARRMFVLQVIAALSVITLLSTTTWSSVSLGMMHGDWLYIVLFVGSIVAIVGTVNGVNMSDGLDGLAAGLCVFAFAAFGIAYFLSERLGGWISGNRTDMSGWALAVLAISIAAACLGFLVFNRHPAKVFMGNVTSMALGAGLVTIALGTGMAGLKLLPIVGFVFVAEVISVLLQVTYFKTTGGKRIFRMAPIHHHFEAKGWPEAKIVGSCWLLGLASAAAGVWLFAYAGAGGNVPFFP